ncbi:MAG: hypothetical protein SFU84_03260 [Gemmatimonadales bacterium]|nr:hypothetical protein [Gemmatimonadales bacterium]
MGWIIGIVVFAVLLKLLWVVLLFAAPVLIPLAIAVGLFLGVVWLWVRAGDVWKAITGPRESPPAELPPETGETSGGR